MRTVCAAASTSATVSLTCEIAREPDASSIVLAPIRSAHARSASGGIASSFAATSYHDGSVRQAGVLIVVSSDAAASGCWTACMARAATGSTSAAKCSTKSSPGSQAKPRRSTIESAQRTGRSEREIVAMVEREVAQVDAPAERRQRLQQRTSRDAA